MVMPSNQARIHPFVPASLLQADQDIAIDDFELNGNSGNDVDNEERVMNSEGMVTVGADGSVDQRSFCGGQWKRGT